MNAEVSPAFSNQREREREREKSVRRARNGEIEREYGRESERVKRGMERQGEPK